MMLIYSSILKIQEFLNKYNINQNQAIDKLKIYLNDFLDKNFFSEQKILKLLAQKYQASNKQNYSLTPIYISSLSSSKNFDEVLLEFINSQLDSAPKKQLTSLENLSADELSNYRSKLITCLLNEFKQLDKESNRWLTKVDNLESMVTQENEKLDIDNVKCLEFFLQTKQYIQDISDLEFRKNGLDILNNDAEFLELLQEKVFFSFKIFMEKIEMIKNSEQAILAIIPADNVNLKQLLKRFIEKCEKLNAFTSNAHVNNLDDYFNFIVSENFSVFFAFLTDVVKEYKHLGFAISLLESDNQLKNALLAPKIYFENFVDEFNHIREMAGFSERNQRLNTVVETIGRTQARLLENNNLFSNSVPAKAGYFSISHLSAPAEQAKPDVIILHNLLRVYNYYTNSPLAERELQNQFGKNSKTGWLQSIETLLNECIGYYWQAGSENESKFFYLNKISVTIKQIESHSLLGGKNSRLAGSLKELYNRYASNESHFPPNNQNVKLPEGLLLNQVTVVEADNFLRKSIIDSVLQLVYGYQRELTIRNFDSTLYLKKKKIKEMISFLEALYIEDENDFEQRISGSLGKSSNVYDVIVQGLSMLLQECGHIPGFYFEDRFNQMLDRVCGYLNKIKPRDSKNAFELLNKPQTIQFIESPIDISIELTHTRPKDSTAIAKSRMLCGISNILRVCDIYASTDLGRAIVVKHKLNYKKSKGNWSGEVSDLAQKAMHLYQQILSGVDINFANITELLDEAMQNINSRRTLFSKGEKLICSFNYLKNLIESTDMSFFDNTRLIGGKPFFMTTSNLEEAENYIQRHMLETLINKISAYQTNHLGFFNAPKIPQKNCYQLLDKLNKLFRMNFVERQNEMKDLSFINYLQKTFNALGQIPGLKQEEQLGEIFSRYLEDAKNYLKTISSPINNI